MSRTRLVTKLCRLAHGTFDTPRLLAAPTVGQPKRMLEHASQALLRQPVRKAAREQRNRRIRASAAKLCRLLRYSG